MVGPRPDRSSRHVGARGHGMWGYHPCRHLGPAKQRGLPGWLLQAGAVGAGQPSCAWQRASERAAAATPPQPPLERGLPGLPVRPAHHVKLVRARRRGQCSRQGCQQQRRCGWAAASEAHSGGGPAAASSAAALRVAQAAGGLARGLAGVAPFAAACHTAIEAFAGGRRLPANAHGAGVGADDVLGVRSASGETATLALQVGWAAAEAAGLKKRALPHPAGIPPMPTPRSAP